MTQIINLLETEILYPDDNVILHQTGIDKRIELQRAVVAAWAKQNNLYGAGDYTDDPAIGNYETYTYFDGGAYFVKSTTATPYNIDSTTYSHPNNDPNLYKAIEYNAVNNNIGTGETEYAAGNHTHVQADITDLSGFIEEVIEDPSPTLGGNLNVNGKYITDTTGNGVRIDAAETTLSRETSANCQHHIYSSLESVYPTGVTGYFLNSLENDGTDEFYIKKQTNSNDIQIGCDVVGNTIGIYTPTTAYAGFGGLVQEFNTPTASLTNGASGVYINTTTGSCITTLTNTFISSKYRSNIVEFFFPYATSRTIVNNTGLPFIFLYPGQTYSTIPNGGSFGMSNYGRFIQTTSTGNYNLLVSF